MLPFSLVNSADLQQECTFLAKYDFKPSYPRILLEDKARIISHMQILAKENVLKISSFPKR
jgi:hypothetical protein